MKYIASGLKHNVSLKRLVMHHCNIGDSGCAVLVNSLLKNSTLRDLILSHNRIRDNGFFALGSLVCQFAVSAFLTGIATSDKRVGEACCQV